MSETQSNPTEQILDQILELAHPMMAESMRLAAIPYWYDAESFAAIRAQDDGRNDGIIERLESQSFVLPVPTATVPTYRVRDEERVLLNIDWINQNALTYLVAHQRSFDYYSANGTAQGRKPSAGTSSLIEDYPQLYHHFFIQLGAANRALILLFRILYKERQLGAIDNLLEMLDDVHEYLHLLAAQDLEAQAIANSENDDDGAGDFSNSDAPNSSESSASGNSASGSSNSGAFRAAIGLPPADALQEFDTLRTHYQARALQLRGEWLESLPLARRLRFAPDLSQNLAPYITRSYGKVLSNTGQHVDGIRQLEEALQGFSSLLPDPNEPWHTEVERAYTMMDLGEAYVDLAQQVRGFSIRNTADTPFWETIRNFGALLLNGPLIVYLSLFLGRRVWMPAYWPTLRHLDWVIARLFARAVSLYERADDILERTPALDEHIMADERLAFLYVAMGDAEQAHHHFQVLKNNSEIPLSDYLHARITVGDAWTHIQRQEYSEAIALIEPVLPVLSAAEDDALTTFAYSFLAEAYMATGDPAPAIQNYRRSIERYVARDDEASATNLVERIELLLDRADAAQLQGAESQGGNNWVEDARRQIADASVILKRRVYDIGFHHPLLRYFRQFLALLIPGAIVIGLLLTLDLETSLSLAPELNINVPLLNPLISASSQVSQGITGTELNIVPDASAGLLFGFLFLGGFLLLGLIVGLVAIQRANLRELEKHQKKIVTIDDESIAIGPVEEPLRVQRQDVVRIVKGDVRLLNGALPQHSGTSLQTPEYSANLPGSTNWYARISQRLNREAFPQADFRNYSYSLLRSWPGVLYGANLLLLGTILLVALFGLKDLKAMLWMDLLGSSYSIADLYPYLFLGAVVVPTWWAIVRPLQISLATKSLTRISWIVLGAGLLLAFMLMLTRFRPLYTVPDIYPVIVIAPSMVMAAYVIWRLKDGQHTHFSQRARVAAVAVALVTTVVLVGAVQQDVRSYHYFIMGNADRDEGNFADARDKYQLAVDIGKQKKWWIFDPVRAFQLKPFGFRLGIPQDDTIPWFSAQKNLAALQAQEGAFLANRAIGNYSDLIDILCPPKNGPSDESNAGNDELQCSDPDYAKFFAWRAMAKARAATNTTEDGEISTRADIYRSAAEDFETATRLDDNNADFFLWSGFTYQSLGRYDDAGYDEAEVAYERASLLRPADVHHQRKILNLRGWMAYEQNQFALAIKYFSTSIDSAAVGSSQTTDLDSINDADNKALGRTQTFTETTSDGSNGAASELIRDELYTDALRGLGYANYAYGRQLNNVDPTDGSVDVTLQVLELYTDAESAWIQLEGTDDYEILKSLGTLHWAKSRLSSDREAQCTEYLQAEDFYNRSLGYDQPEQELAFTHRTLGQIYWLMRGCSALGYDPTEMLRLSIDNYSNAIALSHSDDPFNAFYIHMRGRLRYVSWINQRDNGDPLSQLPTLIDAIDDLRTALEIDRIDRNIEADGSVTAEVFDYQPNSFARGGVLADSLDQLRWLLANSESASANRLWNSLRQLISVLERSNQVLVDRYNMLNQSGLADEEMIYKARLEQGLRISAPEGDIVGLSQARLALDGGDIDEALRLYNQLELNAAELDDYSQLITMRHAAALSLAAGDPEEAAVWYSQLLRTADQADHSVTRKATSDMGQVWQIEGVPMTAAELLTALEQVWTTDVENPAPENPAPENLTPENPVLEHAGFYWDRRAWFTYTLGQEAFKLRDTETANRAIALATVDAERAVALEANTGKMDGSYLAEGAWGAYYIQRGRDAERAGLVPAARSDYFNAYRAYAPVINFNAQREHVDSALLAGRASLILGYHRDAITWYANALIKARSYPDVEHETRLRIANEIDSLARKTFVNPTTQRTKQSIISTLQDWVDASSPVSDSPTEP